MADPLQEAARDIGRWQHTRETGELLPPDELLPNPQVRRVTPTAVWMVRKIDHSPLGNSIEVRAQDQRDGRSITLGSVGGSGSDKALTIDRNQIPALIAALAAAYRWKDEA